MAALAIGAQTALVFIVLAMAGIAFGWCLAIFLLRLVAILALYLSRFEVRAQQREVGF